MDEVEREKRRLYSRAYYEANKEKMSAYAKQKRVEGKDWARKMRQELRQETIKAYGGKCVCCNERHWKFLTIDHPNGDGQADREPHRKNTGQLYGWLKKRGYPKGYYRVLCMNCNWVRRYDTCPHQDKKDPNPFKGILGRRAE